MTGELVPTGKRGPKKQTVQKDETASSDTSSSDIEELIAEKNEEIKVIATGGLNSDLSPITNIFSKIDKQLTLKGLCRIAKIVGIEAK